MTYQDISDLIESFGLPCAYYQFPKNTGQQPPFVCFYYAGSDDLAADNTNYAKIRDLVIELYTDSKDVEFEETIEDALNAAELYYAKDEAYIDSEQMHLVSFSMQLVITTNES